MHSFQPVANIFSDVSISVRGSLSLKNLNQLLRYNPDIGHYVRELKLHLNESLNSWDPSKQDPYADNILALPKVRFPESLQIVGGRSIFHFSCTLWNALHPLLRQPILDRMYSASLTELNITRFILSFASF